MFYVQLKADIEFRLISTQKVYLIHQSASMLINFDNLKNLIHL